MFMLCAILERLYWITYVDHVSKFVEEILQ